MRACYLSQTRGQLYCWTREGPGQEYGYDFLNYLTRLSVNFKAVIDLE
jgi:hypothetical protein